MTIANPGKPNRVHDSGLFMHWRLLFTKICAVEFFALAACAGVYALVGVDGALNATLTLLGCLSILGSSAWYLASLASWPFGACASRRPKQWLNGAEIRRIDVGDDETCAPLARAVDAMASRLGERVEVVESEGLRLSSILSSMVEGVVACDRDLRIVHINAVAARILGSSWEAAIAKPLWEVTRFPRISDTLSETIRAGTESHQEVEIPGGGHDRIIEIKASALRNANDEVTGAVLVLHDVSRLRRLEVVRRDFVANVSHELKTPLTAIEGITETLLEDQEMDAQTRTRFLARLRKQNARLSSLVNDLLQLGRVEDESRSEARSEVDLVSVLERSIEDLRQEAIDKGLDLSADLAAQPQLVLGNAESLRQVSDNLLTNAIRYTPRAGSVRVRTICDSRTVAFEVEDSGIGIEPTIVGRIFERFFRADAARSRELGGTGLGLAIVKHVVQSHGGEVEVESTPGQGSTFRVTLPLATAS